jgi:hypothetical protein
LYGFETWSLTVTKEQRLMTFENRVPRRIYEPKREEVAGGWRRLRNEELHNLCTSPDIIRLMKSETVRKLRNVARRIILECILTECDGKVWTGFVRLRTGTGGGPTGSGVKPQY